MASAELTFVDTNVLAYAHDKSDGRKQALAQTVLEELWASRSGIISTQVLQEFCVVATRKFVPPMSRRAARGIVAIYSTWVVIQVDVPLIVTASEIEERHKLSFWDALIIEAAHRAGATRLLSEDLQTGRTISEIRIDNPFAEAS